MSLPSERILPVEVKDPRINLKKLRTMPVIKSGAQISYQTINANSTDTTNISWNVNPPSGGVIVDRKVYLRIPVTLTINATATAAAQNNTPVFQQAYDCLRAFPLSGCVQTLSMTINTQTVSVPLSTIIHPLQHYHVDEKLKNADYSLTPINYDSTTDYSNSNGFLNSPFSLYMNGKEYTTQSRNAFPFVIDQNGMLRKNGWEGDPLIDEAILEKIVAPLLAPTITN